jgi:hypothetical protein
VIRKRAPKATPPPPAQPEVDAMSAARAGPRDRNGGRRPRARGTPQGSASMTSWACMPKRRSDQYTCREPRV